MGMQISCEIMARRNVKEHTKVISHPKLSKVNKLKSKISYDLRKIPSRAWVSKISIDKLPSEILCLIFSHFTVKELFCNVRPVCRRWCVVAMSPVLWKNIEIGKDIPAEILNEWLKKAKLLKHFAAQDRNDLNEILELISKHNKKLESIKIHNCWGSERSGIIKSKPLCNLVTRCHNLNNFHFNKTSFSSCKFFRLISCENRTGKIMKRCNYVGPMNVKQLKALFTALRSNEVNDSATIGSNNLNHKFKLKDIVRYIGELEGDSAYINNVWENLFYGEHNLDPLVPMEVDNE